MKKHLLLGAMSAALLASPVAAQTTGSSTSTTARDRIGQILGSIFGVGTTADASLDTQWRLGRKPLASQRAAFDTRIDSDVRSRVLTSATGARLKSDYAAVVDLEARYGADGSFTTAERDELSDRYGALTQVLTDGGYADGGTSSRAEVADGRVAFNARVDSALGTRRITRTQATRLKADYAALVTIETNYLRDGVISTSEREDLDERLDALDARVGDVGYTPAVTAKTRLAEIARAVPTSGLPASARTQLLIEHGDLVRLEAAYARLTPSSDERAYLESRLANLETRARVRR